MQVQSSRAGLHPSLQHTLDIPGLSDSSIRLNAYQDDRSFEILKLIARHHCSRTCGHALTTLRFVFKHDPRHQLDCSRASFYSSLLRARGGFIISYLSSKHHGRDSVVHLHEFRAVQEQASGLYHGLVIRSATSYFEYGMRESFTTASCGSCIIPSIVHSADGRGTKRVRTHASSQLGHTVLRYTSIFEAVVADDGSAACNSSQSKVSAPPRMPRSPISATKNFPLYLKTIRTIHITRNSSHEIYNDEGRRTYTRTATTEWSEAGAPSIGDETRV
ncbi:hypothetical protein ACN47E_010309 [Coniothyrium glycines]